MAPSTDLKIGIIGAGPAGLTLASLLEASPFNFDYTIFELRARPDPSDVDRPTGNLDLQEGFGLSAVKAANLYEKFLKIDSGCTEQTIITDKHKNVLMDNVGEGRPEVSRGALAHLLLSGVPDERIKWKTKVVKVVAADASGKGTIEFQSDDVAASSSEQFDLIVGADGAWSRARAAIPSAPAPVYSGAVSVTLDIQDLQGKDPELNKLIGTGTFACCGDQKVILSQRGIHESLRVYLFLHSKTQADYAKKLAGLSAHDGSHGPDPRVDPEVLLSALPENHADLEKTLLTDPDLFADWSDDLKRLIAIGCQSYPAGAEVDARAMYMLPLDPYPHPHAKGIALIGDSAHLMTPFAGKGVNVAMADSLSLAKQLELMASAPPRGKLQDELDETLIAFEEAVHPRAKQAMFLTWLSLGLSYDEEGPAKLVKVMSANNK